MTELIWDGKYDKNGKKSAPVRIELPFQTIETVNESAEDRKRTLDMFASGKSSEWRNRLIWGDKKYVLPSLLPEFAGKVNLIYIDPPFDTGADFSFTATVPSPEGEDEGQGEGETSFVKEPSIIEQKAYRDTWGVSPEERERGKTHLDKYLQWFYETALLLRDLLAEDGSIYVHLGWQVSSHVKIILDEVFGYDNFQNEIVWNRTNAHNFKSKGFIRSHETLYVYTAHENFTWNPCYTEYSKEQLKRYKMDESGRLFTGQDLTYTGTNPQRQFEWRGVSPPKGRVWGSSLEQLEKLWKEGRILKTKDGKPRLDGYKMYLDEAKEDWLRAFGMILIGSVIPHRKELIIPPKNPKPSWIASSKLLQMKTTSFSTVFAGRVPRRRLRRSSGGGGSRAISGDLPSTPRASGSCRFRM